LNPTLAIEFSTLIYSIEVIAIAFLGAFVGKLEEDLKAVVYKINDPINFFKIDKSINKDSV
jgi:hypothetical protein